MKRRTAVAAMLPVSLLMALALLAGCTGVPTSSAAVDVTQIEGQMGSIAPHAPQPGQQPDQIVRGFIDASARLDLDVAAGTTFTAARQYLTPQAQESWRPVGNTVVVLADDYRTDVDAADPGTVTVTGESPGVLDTQRAYHSVASTYTHALSLEQVDGEWRISNPPPELLLTSADFPTAFRQRTLYFLDQTGTVVVPDPRHLAIGQTTANRASRLLGMLISGPSSALQGAVKSQFTAASEMRSNPTVDADGVLRVDLTGVDVTTPEARRSLLAQIVWTLSPTAPRIAVTVDGAPLDPTQEVATITSVTSYDPDRLAGTGAARIEPYFVDSRGAILSLTNLQPVGGALGTGQPRVRSAAMSAATGALAAVADDPAGGQQLLTYQPTGTGGAAPVLKADTLTAPSFSRQGEQAWVVQNGASPRPEIYRVSAVGGASRERIGSAALLGRGAVTALVLSPDGVRVAVIAGSRLFLGTVAPAAVGDLGASAPDGGSPDGAPVGEGTTAGSPLPEPTPTPPADPAGQTVWTISNFVEVRSDLADVGAVAFSSSREMVVAANTAGAGYRTLVTVSLDGYDLRPVTDQGIFGDVTAVAVATGEQPLITFGGRVWQLAGSQIDGQWQSPITDSPVLTGSSPFFPR